MLMIFLFILSLVVFTLGLCFIMFRYGGIPASISDSYYLLPEKLRTPIFYVWILLVAGPLMVVWLELSEGQTFQFLVFLACAGLCFVGAAGDFKQSLTKSVHVGGALICAGASMLWVFIYTDFWLFSLIFLALFTLFGSLTKGIVGSVNGPISSKNTLTFYLELVAFFSTYLGVWSYLI